MTNCSVKRGPTLAFLFLIAGALMACGGNNQTPTENVARVSSAATLQDFERLRAKSLLFLTGGLTPPISDPDYAEKLASISAHAQDLLTGSNGYPPMNTAPSQTRPYVWPDLTYTVGSNAAVPIQTTYERLRDLTLALKTPGSKYNDPVLETTIIGTLNWLAANWYGPTVPYTNDWYTWEIGVPLALTDIVTMLAPDLTTTQRYNYMNSIDCYVANPQDDPNSGLPVGVGCQPFPSWVAKSKTGYHHGSGANHAWEAQIYVEWGALVDSGILINLGSTGVSALLPDATSGDGFYADGSYIGHTYYAYTGGYGTADFGAPLTIAHLLQGSLWQVTDPNLNNLTQWAFNSFQPFVYKGAGFPSVQGRNISKQAESDHNFGHWIVTDFLLAADLFPAQASTFLGQAKAWIQQDTEYPYYSDTYTSLFDISLAKQSAAPPSGNQSLYRQFPAMDRLVAQRPGTANFGSFAFSVSMFSDRTKGPEMYNNSTLQDNLKGWYQGYGMTYLYTANELNQYTDAYWPTVNPYYLPGTTVEHIAPPATPSGPDFNLENWSGGATDGFFGASGFYLKPKRPSGQSQPEGKKSWFVFDNEIVCVGSGITTTGTSYMETVVDDRRLNSSGNNTLTVNGATKPSTLGWSELMTFVHTVHLQGNAANSDIGYYFPTAQQTVRAERAAGTGCWQDVSSDNLPCADFTRNYLTLWLKHTDSPANGTYAYVLLPNFSLQQTLTYANAPDVAILKQDTSVHAVKDNTIYVTMANFWNDNDPAAVFSVGANHPNWLRSNKKASVIETETTVGNVNYAEFSVADPTQSASGPIVLQLAASATAITTPNPHVTVSLNTNPTVITVDTAGALGQSLKVKFQIQYPPR